MKSKKIVILENNEELKCKLAEVFQKGGHNVRLTVAPRDTMSEVHLCRKSPSFV